VSAPKRVINFGIIGTGKSAHNFAKALTSTRHGKLIAVGSRKKERAKKFAKEFRLPFYLSSYEKLANNSEVDVIYIATPNACHKDNALTCLNAGKNVLIEKSFSTNFKDAKILINLAIEKRLFLMEAMWTRFLPAFNKMEQLIDSGEIGELKSFNATLGQPSVISKDSNLFNYPMGGGATLDLGIYLVFWAHYLFGIPARVQSDMYYGDADVDLTTSTILSYDQGRYAHISSSIITRFTNNGIIYGTKGAIEIHQPLYCPTAISVIKYSKASRLMGKQSILSSVLSIVKRISLLKNLYINYPLLGRYILRKDIKKTIYMPIKGNGLQYMIEEVSNHLLGNNSQIIPLDETLAIMETIDKIKSTPNAG
jgi:predicted dehydrogenase